MLSLQFEMGPRSGETVALDKSKVTFGRHLGCDCVLPHPTVSREHFLIERAGGKYILVDNGSGNGTLVNGVRITWVELKDGDKIQAGPFTLITRSKMEEAPKTTPMPEETEAQIADHAPYDSKHAMIYPREYLEGIKFFNSRKYFEAHEAWEEIWLHSSGDAKVFYQMLIQAAVGLHHYERGNGRGARGMYKNVNEKLSALPEFFMSLDLADFSRMFKGFFAELIEAGNEAAPPADRPRPLIRLLGADEGV